MKCKEMIIDLDNMVDGYIFLVLNGDCFIFRLWFVMISFLFDLSKVYIDLILVVVDWISNENMFIFVFDYGLFFLFCEMSEMVVIKNVLNGWFIKFLKVEDLRDEFEK